MVAKKAYVDTLVARHLIRLRQPDTIQRARALASAAIETDSSYAPAYATRALATILNNYYSLTPISNARAVARAAGEPEPESTGATVRAALESVAAAVRRTLAELDTLLGRRVGRVAGEDPGAGASAQDVVDGAGHLVASGVDGLGPHVGCLDLLLGSVQALLQGVTSGEVDDLGAERRGTRHDRDRRRREAAAADRPPDSARTTDPAPTIVPFVTTAHGRKSLPEEPCGGDFGRRPCAS